MADASEAPADSQQFFESGNILVVGSGDIDPQREHTELWMPDGRVIRVATATLGPLTASALTAPESPSTVISDKVGGATIPIVEERLTVEKRTVPTGKVQLKKVVQTYQEALDEPLVIQTFDVERIAINRVVDTSPSTRQEGNTTIYPIVEERLVLTKELILTEEVRITKRETEMRDTQVVTLRREQLNVVRTPIDKD